MVTDTAPDCEQFVHTAPTEGELAPDHKWDFPTCDSPADVQPTGPSAEAAQWWALQTRAEPSPIRWPKSRAAAGLTDADVQAGSIG